VPTEPLIDFERLDLSRVVVSMDDVRRHLKQRNRFEMLDGILHLDLPGKLVVGFKEIRADDWWASDHIPGRPIFPGVLMVEGAAQMCSFDYLRRTPESAGKFVGFAGLNDTRFRGIVTPPCRLIWAGTPTRMRSSLFTYHAQGFVDRKLVFESEIVGVVL
jgi:3-hydroxyacyl-[acyl-carrier-protein] dehydratase